MSHERKHLMSMMIDFDSVHFPEVQRYKQRFLSRIPQECHFAIQNSWTHQVNIEELMSAQHKPVDAIVIYEARSTPRREPVP